MAADRPIDPQEIGVANFDNRYQNTGGQADVVEPACHTPSQEGAPGNRNVRIFKKVVAASAVAMLATGLLKSSLPRTNIFKISTFQISIWCLLNQTQ